MIQQVASSFFPEKSTGRAAFSLAVCEDMGVGARGAGCTGAVTRGGFPGVGSEGVLGDDGGKG